MSQIVCIEGNIGSGKSTLLNVLKRNYENQKHLKNIPTYIFVDEPLDIWNTIRDKAGVTILQHFYNDQQKYSFTFQMMAYISRLIKLKEAIQNNPNSIIVVERSIFTDRHVFASMLYRNGKINEIEHSVYLMWFNHFIQELPEISLVYIRTEPDICISRIRKRDRDGEEKIQNDYIEMCHMYHDDMIMDMTQKNIRVLTLNGNENKSIHTLKKDIEYSCWVKEIRDFIYNSNSIKKLGKRKVFIE